LSSLCLPTLIIERYDVLVIVVAYRVTLGDPGRLVEDVVDAQVDPAHAVLLGRGAEAVERFVGARLFVGADGERHPIGTVEIGQGREQGGPERGVSRDVGREIRREVGPDAIARRPQRGPLGVGDGGFVAVLTGIRIAVIGRHKSYLYFA